MWAWINDNGKDVELHFSAMDLCDQVREQIDYYYARGSKVTKIIMDREPVRIYDVPVERETGKTLQAMQEATDYRLLCDRVTAVEKQAETNYRLVLEAGQERMNMLRSWSESLAALKERVRNLELFISGITSPNHDNLVDRVKKLEKNDEALVQKILHLHDLLAGHYTRIKALEAKEASRIQGL